MLYEWHPTLILELTLSLAPVTLISNSYGRLLDAHGFVLLGYSWTTLEVSESFNPPLFFFHFVSINIMKTWVCIRMSQ